VYSTQLSTAVIWTRFARVCRSISFYSFPTVTTRRQGFFSINPVSRTRFQLPTPVSFPGKRRARPRRAPPVSDPARSACRAPPPRLLYNPLRLQTLPPLSLSGVCPDHLARPPSPPSSLRNHNPEEIPEHIEIDRGENDERSRPASCARFGFNFFFVFFGFYPLLIFLIWFGAVFWTLGMWLCTAYVYIGFSWSKLVFLECWVKVFVQS
jgi:hypothetical protein